MAAGAGVLGLGATAEPDHMAPPQMIHLYMCTCTRNCTGAGVLGLGATAEPDHMAPPDHLHPGHIAGGFGAMVAALALVSALFVWY